MTDEYQIDGTTHAEKNSNGDIEHKPDVVNTGAINNTAVADRALQAAYDRAVVPVYNNSEMGDAIDIANSSTPIQDAIDDINANGQDLGGTAGAGGTILLPPTNINEAGSLSGFGGIEIIGWGTNNTMVSFDPALNTHGLEISQKSDAQMSYIDGVTLQGGGSSRTSGSAIYVDGVGTSNFNLGHVELRQWDADPVINMVNAAQPYRSSWTHIRLFDCDATGWYCGTGVGGTSNWCGVFGGGLGGNNPLLEWRGTGREQRFDTVLAFDTTFGGVLAQTQGDINIGHIHHELQSEPSTAEPYLWLIEEDGPVEIGTNRVMYHNFDYVYRLGNNSGNNILKRPELRSSDQPNSNVVEVVSAQSAVTEYHAPASEVDFAFNSISDDEMIWSHHDQKWADALGTADNPETIDISGGVDALSAEGRSKPVYHVELRNTAGTSGQLAAVDNLAPTGQGPMLIVRGFNLTSPAEIPDSSGTGDDNFKTSDGANVTLDTAGDIIGFVYSSGSWREVFRNLV